VRLSTVQEPSGCGTGALTRRACQSANMRIGHPNRSSDAVWGGSSAPILRPVPTSTRGLLMPDVALCYPQGQSISEIIRIGRPFAAAHTDI